MANPKPPRPVKEDSPRTAGRRGDPRAWQLETLEERVLLSSLDAGYFPGIALAREVWRFPKPPGFSAIAAQYFAATPDGVIGTGTYDPSPTVTSLTQAPAGATAFYDGAGGVMGPVPSPLTTSIAFLAARAQDPGSVTIAGIASSAAIPDWRIAHYGDPSGSPLPPPPPFLLRGPIPGLSTIGFFTGGFHDDSGGDMPHFGLRAFLTAAADLHREKGGMIGQSPDASQGVDEVALPEVLDLPPLFSQAPFSDGESDSPTSTAPEQAILQASASGAPAGALSILVTSEDGGGETLLPTIVLSHGGVILGALHLDENLPEWEALASSVLDELLGGSAAVSFPLLGRLQLVAELGPLDDSSLAVAATLLTVTAEAPASSGSGEAESAADAAVPAPPSWAGFVIGLDEAFEANRQAAHDWPSASFTLEPAPVRASARGERSRSNPSEPIDEALRLLDREGQASPRGDDLFVPAPPQDDEDAPEEPAGDVVAGAASLIVATAPALLAGKVNPAPRLRRERLGMSTTEEE